MSRSSLCKGCIMCGVILVIIGGSILAWQLLTNNEDGDNSTESDRGGLFGTGLFGGNNNNNNATTSSPNLSGSTMAPTASMSPSAAPSPEPFVYPYEFNQCAPDATRCCNGLENLCDWPANDILYAIPHNAMATNEFFIVPNQLRPVEQALEAGFRGVNIDVCLCGGQFKLCHGFCGLGEVDPGEFVETIVTFMNQPENRNEVILMTMELNSEAGSDVDLNVFYDTVLSQVTGFEEHLYVHNGTGEPWPTLGTLIENNKRLMVFHLNGPNCAEVGSCPDGLHYYFGYAQETEFDLPSVDSIRNTATSCLITRGATTTDGSFFGVNNFVTTGSFDIDNLLEAASETNALDFAKQRIADCSQLKADGVYHGDASVNLLYVDFWSIGSIIQVVQEHNRNLGTYPGL